MSFESDREKEKLRQDLREARKLSLDNAKKWIDERTEHEAGKLIKRGKTSSVLTSEGKKVEKLRSKKSKKHCKKKNHKKRKNSSSDDGSESANTDCSLADNYRKSSEIEKQMKKGKNLRPKESSHISGSDEIRNIKDSEEPLRRDCWMTDAPIIKTYSRERVEKKQNIKQNTYDPVKSSRELNPYWKSTATGLPAFLKPNDNDDSPIKLEKLLFPHKSLATKDWRKQCNEATSQCLQPQKEFLRTSSESQPCSYSDAKSKKEVNEKHGIYASEFLTDQQMNDLGAKILKAEIMGNMELASELGGMLEKARTQRNVIKERQKSAYLERKEDISCTSKSCKSDNNKEEHILLTHTDQFGNTRPLPASTILDPKDMYSQKKKHKRFDSHDNSGKRIRYFVDDDQYDIKHMFEREKYVSAAEVNFEFANSAGKHKNSNDDLDDIFTEKICQGNSLRSDKQERSRAIRAHEKTSSALDNCEKCFDSIKMQKELLVCVGENVYLALPWYQGLQSGHCLIIPNQHASCCTQMDEDTWAEVTAFRKALTHMFAAQNKDVIFFEIANKLHRRPHLAVHCIPISQSVGEMAPFYFKKAIEESEHEWCINKQLISLRFKSLRNSIPKGLPYFWVNFGMDLGFAHVIEDEERFPINFAQEIIGGFLNLNANNWRRPQKEQNAITKVKMFTDWWKKFDCTR